MPNGLWYAGGPYKTEESIPSSAYSKGDVLVYTSASSFSRSGDTTLSEIDAIALAGSDQTLSNKHAALIPQPETLFWASLSTVLTSHATPDSQADILFKTGDNNRYYVDPASTNTPRALIVRGTQDIDQSVQSHVLVRLIYSGGALD